MSIFEQAPREASEMADSVHRSAEYFEGDPPFEMALGAKALALEFRYQNSDGESEAATHPVALSFEHDGRILDVTQAKQLRSEDKVLIQPPGSDKPTWIPFEGYLDMFGSNYHEYLRVLKEKERVGKQDAHSDVTRRQQALLFDVHRAAINRRTEDVRMLRARYERTRLSAEDFQQETRAHSETFRKLFDDLNIPGLGSAEARRRNDYQDTIDDFILLDPEALSTGAEDDTDTGKPDYDRYLHIGVQRTFGSQGTSHDAFESDQVKQKKIQDKPLYWIPEHLEWGPVARVYLRERLEDYGIEGKGGQSNYTERLYTLRAKQSREQGVAANTLELPPLYRVLGDSPAEGKEQQHLWARQVLTRILKKFEGYAASALSEDQKEIFERYSTAVALAIHRIEEQLVHLREQHELRQRKAS